MTIHAPFLKYFREVANCGSVRMAARHLHISSSAVNRQILKVENELGISLFQRTSNGMLLTPAGRVLSEHAADVEIVFDVEPAAGTSTLMTRQLPVGAIVSPDHPFASRSQISIRECAAYPLILPDQSWPLRRILDDRLQTLSTAPSVLTTSNSIEFLHNMINQQLGIGFQTAVGIERRLLAGELVMVPLHDPEPLLQRLSLCISTNHRASDVFQFLLSLLLERLGSYADDWS